jgi:DNA-binding SARP family transcriptional activator/predicted ATPase/tetratricopeptide (TPR) repeat protein
MTKLSIYLLGPMRIVLNGESVTQGKGDRLLALLAYLALHAGAPCRREALAGLLWPDRPDRVALRNLRQALSSMRTLIGDRDAHPPLLLVTRQALQLNPEGDWWLDANVFSAAIAAAQGHPHARLEACTPCMQHLRQAAALYRGDLMAGFSFPSAPFEGWLVVQRERLHGQALEALAALAAYHEGHGTYREAIGYARRQVALEPWREGAHRQWMRALAQSGRRSAALAQYEICRRTLDEELGAHPADETVALYEAIRDGAVLPARCPPLPNNLPAATTPFVGREPLLDELRSLLQDPSCRLVTLVGPGGSGKTRLALQFASGIVAGARRDRFPDGVYFVPLGALRSGESIGPAVAQALGTGAGPGDDPEGQLLRVLRRKRLLLVLDNYEHLLGGAQAGRLYGAGAAAEILAAAPGVQILVTSRARLNVLAEHILPVGGMAFPVANGQEGEQIARHSAVALFLDRARALRPTFAPDGAALAQVGRICRLAEGMPLAILLAASWVDVLSPAEIAGRMAASLDLLAADLGDLPARQRSMRAVFDASWAILSEAARTAFARMSVFRGGFTEEVAQKVAGAGLRTLRELIRTSCLQRMEEGRYEIHELLRQYGAEQLEKTPADREETLDRHCTTYAAFLTTRAGALRDSGGIGPVAGEVANIYAAWHWALDAARLDRVRQFVGRLDLGLGKLDEHTLAWYSGGEEAWVQAVSLLRAAGEDRETAIALGIALRSQATHAAELGHLDRFTALIEESMAILERCGAKAELSIAKVDASFAVGRTADGIERLLREGLALARETNYEHGLWRASHFLAGPVLHRRAFEEAEGYVRDALLFYKRKGHVPGLCIGLGTLAAIAYARGDDAAARRCVEESIAVADEIGWPIWWTRMRAALGTIVTGLGETAEARTQCRRVIEIAPDLGDDLPLVYALCGLGDTVLADGSVEEAKAYYRQALTLAADDPRFLPAWRTVYSVALLRAREGCLERAAALSALGLDPMWAWSFWYGAGLRLAIELERRMAPAAFATAQERGRATSLQETAKELLEELGKDP